MNKQIRNHYRQTCGKLLLTGIFSLISLVAFPQTTIYSASGGAWAEGATWIGGIVPAPGDNAVIRKGHTVSLATGSGETINSLTIRAGGVLDARNKPMAVTGTLIVDGTYTSDDNSAKDLDFSGDTIGGTGTIAVNDASRYLDIASDVVIIPSSYLHLFGNAYLRDNVTVSNRGHVEVNGNIVGQDAAGSVWTQEIGSELEIAGSLLITGTLNASAAGNLVKYFLQGPQDIKTPGDFTYFNLLISGSDVKTLNADLVIDHDLLIASGTLNGNNFDIELGGDWTNESDFLEGTGTVVMSGTADQSISNPAGEQFFGLTVSKPSGNLILESDVIVANTLTMTAGIIKALSGKLTLGTGLLTPGAVVHSGGHIFGSFERWINVDGTYTYPIGSSFREQFLYITLNGLQNGGTLSAEFRESDPTNTGLPLYDNPDSVFNAFVDGYWNMTHANGFVLGLANDYTIILDGTGFTAFPVNSSTRVLIRPDGSSDWDVQGIHLSPLGSSARRTGLTAVPAQFAFGDTSNCSRPSTSAISGTVEVCTGSTGIAYSVADNPPDTYAWIITGGTQAGGDSSNSITVDWGATGTYGNVRVIESNTCTQGAPQDFPVTVHSIQPAKISGRSSVAEYTSGEPYSVPGVSGYSYYWSITGGIQNPAGNGSSITVDWDSNGVGLVSVVAQMPGCPVAPATELNVNKYVIIESIASGSWDDKTTWDCDCVPLPTENVRINNTHTVTLPNGPDTEVNHLIIEAGGILNSNNKALYIHGNFIVNGTYQGASKTLEMDGFGMYIDGTGNINQGISLAANVYFTTTAVINISNGDVSIGNGNIISNFGTVRVANNITGSNASSKWINKANSTLSIGQAILSTGILDASAPGNVVDYGGTGPQSIKLPSSTYSHLSTSGNGLKTLVGNIDVEEGIWLNGTAVLDVSGSDYSIHLAGDWFNQGGTFDEQSGRVYLDGTADQSIYGGETFYDLELINTADLLLDTSIIIVDSLIMKGGNIHPGTDTLKIGTGTGTPGAVSHSSGSVTGNMERWITATGTPYLFPIGTSSAYRPAILTFSDLNQGSVVARFLEGDPGSAGLPLSEGAVNIMNQYTEGYWEMSAKNGLSSLDFDLQLTATNFTSYALIPGSRILKRPAGGDWVLDGVHAAGNPPELYRNSLTGGIFPSGTHFGIGHVDCPVLTVDRVITDVSCFGGNDGAIDVTVNGGTAPYFFAWGHGPASEDVINLSAGAYDLNVRDSDGCEVDSTFIVSEPPILNADVDSTRVTCVGGSDGSITVSNPSGGGGTYEYSVNGPGGPWQDTGSFTGLFAGSYDVRIRDAAVPACIMILNPALNLSEPNDFIPPLAVCRDTAVYLDAAGTAAIDSSYVDGGSTDNCGIAAMAIDLSTFTCTDIGTNTVQLTVTDVNSNSAICFASVTVLDTISPLVSCPGDQVEILDTACQLGLPDYTGLVGVTENCAIISLVQSPAPGTPLSGHGTTQPVTVTATDASANVGQCTFNVILDDAADPVAVCTDTTVYLDATGSVLIDSSHVNGGSTDNCGIAYMDIDISSFNCTDLGANTVILNVTDLAGNSDFCTAIVTVVDTISPVVTCPGDRIEALDALCQFSLPDYTGMAGVTENCSLGSLVQSPVPGTILTGHGTTQLVTITATDGSANSGQCTFSVTLADETDPVAVCNDTTVYLNSSGTAAIDTSYLDGGSTDNCGIAAVTIDVNTFTCNDIGANPVTLTVTDLAGNTDFCTATVTVLDTVSPAVTCPGDRDEPVDGSLNFILADYTSLASSSDNCTALPALSQDPVPGTVISGIGTIQAVTITADDGNGNTAQCSFNITLLSPPLPTIICPPDRDENLDGNCQFVLPDYTGLATVTGEDTVIQSPSPGTIISGGFTAQSIILTAKNVLNDSAWCTFNVDIRDDIAPVISCRNDTTITLSPGNCSIAVTDIAPFPATDNCALSGISYRISGATSGSGDNDASGTSFNKGVSTVWYIAADESGNSDSCSFTVTILTSVVPPDNASSDRDTVCAGDGSIQLAYSGGIMVEGGLARWYDDASMLNPIGSGNPLIIEAPLISTDYFVRFEGTCDTSSAVQARVETLTGSVVPVSATADRNDICPGDGMITLSYSGGMAGNGAIAQWYADSALTQKIGIGNNLPLASPLVTTSYFVRFEGLCDTSGTAGFLLIVKDMPSAPASAECDHDSVCPGTGSIVLSYTGGDTGSGGSAEWYTDSLFTSRVGSGNNLTLAAPPVSTSYYVRFEADCDTSSAVSVRVHTRSAPVPVFTETDDQACTSGMLSRYVVRGLPGSSYTWGVRGGSILADYGDSILVDWGNVPGDYDVSVYETTWDGCESESILATVSVGGPDVDLGPELEICGDETVEVIPSGNFTIHMWHDGSTGPSYIADTTEIVKIQVFDNIGCTAIDSVRVDKYPLPVVDLGNDTSLCGEASVVLDAGNPGAVYAWSTGATTRQIEVSAGAQLYRVEVTYGSDCTASGEMVVKECSIGESFANIPNLITPNGDGANDTWFFYEAAAYPDIVVEIYDRWGKLVFRSEPGYSNPWDGRNMNGREMPMDSYHYIIKIGEDEITGTITVVR